MVSLPKLLWGHNGKVIATQSELDEGLEKFAKVMDKAAVVPPLEEWDPWRVDVAWNFELPTGALIRAHSALRFPGDSDLRIPIPGIRNEPMCCDGQSVSWRGSKSRFVLTLYDKGAQMGVAGKDVMRAELRLCGEHIEKRLPDQSWRDFNSLYSAFRGVMILLPMIEKPQKALGVWEAIGLEPPEVRDRILNRLAYVPERTFRRYRKRVEAAAYAAVHETFSWKQILAPSHPPEPVTVEPTIMRKRTKRI